MAGHRTILQQASFRGVRFHVEGSEAKFAYDFVFHKFPGRVQKAMAEEICEDAEVFTIEAFLIGDEAHYTLDLLRRACRRREPGKLVHPQVGIINAKCKSFLVRESHTRIGKLHLQMEFIEASTTPTSAMLDELKGLLDAADRLFTESALAFAETFSVIDMPAYVIASAARLIDKTHHFVLSENGLARTASAIDGFARASGSLLHESALLLKAPQALAAQVARSLGGLHHQSLLRVREALRNESLPHGPKTASRVRELSNHRALVALVGLTAIATASTRLATATRPQGLRKPAGGLTAGKAKEMVDALLTGIDEHMAETSHDELFARLHTLKSQLTASLLHKTEHLPRETLLHLDEAKPSIVLAYELYDDLAREADIISRNHATNPAHMGGQSPIEVLT